MSNLTQAGLPTQPARFGAPAQENSPPDQGGGEDDRRRRAAIAAQACETCRTRKSKCDERRPKCGLCERLGVTCTYREPQPTKKDKTLVEMMTVLNRIDAKIDVIGHTVTSGGNSMFALGQQPSQSSSGPLGASTSAAAVASTPPPPVATTTTTTITTTTKEAQGQVSPMLGIGRRPSGSHSGLATERDDKKRKSVPPQLTPPHKLLMWPHVYMYLIQNDVDNERELQRIMLQGTPYFIKKEVEKHSRVLPPESTLESRPIRQDAMPGRRHEIRVEFVSVPFEKMRTLAKSFFMTYHCSHPAIDPVEFENETLRLVMRHGFGTSCEDSVIVLLVFALGEMAIEGTTGKPWAGSPNSGIRGGTIERPPGLNFFNEARKRLAFTTSACSLKTVQALVLVAIYYEACARHMDHYRAVMDACLTMQVIINTEHPIDWSSPQGNRIKILYHVCNSLESWFHFDLDLPGTNISELNDTVTLLGGDSVSYVNPDDEQIALHFLAISSLSRLITRVQEGIYQELFTSELGLPYTGPPYQLLLELRRQLDNWRNLLPQALQWYDDDRLNFPLADERSRIRGSRMFSPRLEDVAGSVISPSLDIMQAEMRARYYYVVMLINRPHLFKLIHYPESVESRDRAPIIQCIKACLLWPVALFPLKDKKRLVSYLYAWTTNFMGVLVILRLVLRPGPLRIMVEPYILPEEVETTVAALLEWIRDMSQIEGTAEWAWNVMRSLYSDVDFVVNRGLLV